MQSLTADTPTVCVGDAALVRLLLCCAVLCWHGVRVPQSLWCAKLRWQI
jgi:hypothetical protein